MISIAMKWVLLSKCLLPKHRPRPSLCWTSYHITFVWFDRSLVGRQTNHWPDDLPQSCASLEHNWFCFNHSMILSSLPWGKHRCRKKHGKNFGFPRRLIYKWWVFNTSMLVYKRLTQQLAHSLSCLSACRIWGDTYVKKMPRLKYGPVQCAIRYWSLMICI